MHQRTSTPSRKPQSLCTKHAVSRIKCDLLPLCLFGKVECSVAFPLVLKYHGGGKEQVQVNKIKSTKQSDLNKQAMLSPSNSRMSMVNLLKLILLSVELRLECCSQIPTSSGVNLHPPFQTKCKHRWLTS